MNDYFSQVEDELVKALARETRAAAIAVPDRRRRRLPRAVIALTALFVVIVPTSAAITGVWPRREPDGLVRTGPPRVIAEGTTSPFGPYQATLSQSDRGLCVGLRLLDPPGPNPDAVFYEGCGSAGGPAKLGGGDGPEHTGYFGLTKSDATAVRLAGAGIAPVTVPTTPTASGAFYFVALNKRHVREPELVAINRAGGVVAIILGETSPPANNYGRR